MEVGEVGDPEADELLRNTPQGNVELAKTNPSRLEMAPGDASGGRRDSRFQTSNCSTTGETDTTCRLKFSSDSSRPAATPISCDRWRIGMSNDLPVAFCSFDCHASSDRWQSGHGVTIASAPASIACSIGWISSPSATSSRAWMIGKPQHLILAG